MPGGFSVSSDPQEIDTLRDEVRALRHELSEYVSGHAKHHQDERAAFLSAAKALSAIPPPPKNESAGLPANCICDAESPLPGWHT